MEIALKFNRKSFLREKTIFKKIEIQITNKI